MKRPRRPNRTTRTPICENCKNKAESQTQPDPLLNHLLAHKGFYLAFVLLVFACCVYVNLPLAELKTQSIAEAAQTILYQIGYMAVCFLGVVIVGYVCIIKELKC